MNPGAVIEVENLSKRYLIGHRTPPGTLRDWLAHGMGGRLLRGAAGAGAREEFWALRDLSFSIGQGEIVGIIGRNGAGKSTLLKILSRITEPTAGCIRIRGRVASLLEVGTGFHPELTGRDNIFLNGAILGMSRVEIRRKFDDIVAFAEVERFIDTPVKHYSSGMYVRLAFAVAAHLEPEVLIVDEVLAVGDHNFQKKCLGKMGEVAKHGGRTILFVSHNMAAIQRLCSRSILLQGGRIVAAGPTAAVVAGYLTEAGHARASGAIRSGPAGLEIAAQTDRGEPRSAFRTGDPVRFVLNLDVDRPVRNAAIGIGISDLAGERVITLHTRFQLPAHWSVEKSARLVVDWPECILCPGTYRLGSALYEGAEMLASWDDLGQLEIAESDYFGTGQLPNPLWQGRVVTKARWRTE